MHLFASHSTLSRPGRITRPTQCPGCPTSAICAAIQHRVLRAAPLRLVHCVRCYRRGILRIVTPLAASVYELLSVLQSGICRMPLCCVDDGAPSALNGGASLESGIQDPVPVAIGWSMPCLIQIPV